MHKLRKGRVIAAVAETAPTFFHVYFIPTSASWLNMVERFFRDLTQNRLRRGVFRDVEELIMAIEGYIHRHNEDPQTIHLGRQGKRHSGKGEARQKSPE